MILPDAANSASSPADERPLTRTETDSPVASFIWEATVRFQISSYRRSSSPDSPARAELGFLPRRRAPADPHRDRLPGGVLHLGGDGALPDQLVQAQLVAGQPGPGRARLPPPPTSAR